MKGKTKEEVRKPERIVHKQSRFDKSVLIPMSVISTMVNNGAKIRYFTFE